MIMIIIPKQHTNVVITNVAIITFLTISSNLDIHRYYNEQDIYISILINLMNNIRYLMTN